MLRVVRASGSVRPGRRTMVNIVEQKGRGGYNVQVPMYVTPAFETNVLEPIMRQRGGRENLSGLRSTSPEHGELQGTRDPAGVSKQTIGRYYALQARRVGRRKALTVPHQNVSWTYIDLKKRIDGVVSSWLDFGVRSGTRVVALQETKAEQYLVQAAAARLGLLVAPVDSKTSAEELALVIDRFIPSVVVVSNTLATKGKGSALDLLDQVMPEVGQVQHENFLRSPKYPTVRVVYLTGVDKSQLYGQRPLHDAPAWGPLGLYEHRMARIEPVQTPDSPLIALPDGKVSDRSVVYTQQNAMTAGVSAARTLGMSEEDRVVVSGADAFRPVANVVGVHAALAAGAELVLTRDDAQDTVKGMVGATGAFLSAPTALSLVPVLASPLGEGKGKKQKKKKKGEAAEAEPAPADEDKAAAPPASSALSLRWVAVFEDSTSDRPVTPADLKKLREAFGAGTVHLFKGPPESATMLQSSVASDAGVSAAEIGENMACRVVGDEGGELAKTLGRGQEGRLRLWGPAVCNRYFTNAGMLGQAVDVLGFNSTPHDATVRADGTVACTRAR